MKCFFSFFLFLGVLQFNFLLGADLQSDLAKLDVELTSLSKMIPVGKRALPKIPKKSETPKKPESPKQGIFEGVKKGVSGVFEGAKKWAGFGKNVSFDDAKKYWPVGTEIKISNKFENIDDGIESLKRAGKSNIPEGTIIRPAGYFKYEVTIGKKSYNLWHNAKFDTPFVTIDPDDYEAFPEDTKIYISGKLDPLVVGSDEKIPGIDRYVDEEDFLLGVVRINNQDLTKFVGKPGLLQYSDVIDEVVG